MHLQALTTIIEQALTTKQLESQPITLDTIYRAVQSQGVTYLEMVSFLREHRQWTRPLISDVVEDAYAELKEDGKGRSITTIHAQISPNSHHVPLYEVACYMRDMYSWLEPKDSSAVCAKLVRDVESVVRNIFIENDSLNIDSILARLSSEHSPMEVAAYLHDFYGWNDGWNEEVKYTALRTIDALTKMFTGAYASPHGKVKSAIWHGKRHNGHELLLECERGNILLTIPELPDTL